MRRPLLTAADVASLQKVREYKQQQKAAAKAGQ
jgi:hypothetical protein